MELGVQAAGLNGRAASRSIRPFWPVVSNAGQTRPAGGTDRVCHVPCVNMCANSRSRPYGMPTTENGSVAAMQWLSTHIITTVSMSLPLPLTRSSKLALY